MPTDRERLERLLGGDPLRSLRSRLRRRFALRPDTEVLALTKLAPEERRALEGLLGRAARDAGSLRVSVAELDHAIQRAELAASFRHALELLDGPIADLAAERAERARMWQAVFAAELDPRVRAFVESAAARGLVKRLASGQPPAAAQLLGGASAVLARLPAPGWPRSRLAADALGDAHALDSGRPLSTLALAVLRTEPDERERETWARAGVLVNELAAPALLLNLPAETDTPAGRLARTAAELGMPLHLSLRALLRPAPRFSVRGRDVFVCENPNVVAIAADRLGVRCAPLVCTDGMPSASQRTLLQQLRAGGATLHYHGDFDWPGIQIANFVLRTCGAQPWRLGARDYTPRGGRALAGTAVTASWDPELAPRMESAGHALEEEAVVEALLQDLAVAAAPG